MDESDFVADSDDGDDADDPGFAASVESLSLSAHVESDGLSADTTLTPSRLRDAAIIIRAGSLTDVGLDEQDENSTPSRPRRDRLRTLYPRSASSPSPARRSPHRLPTARKLAARRNRKAKNNKKGFAGAVGTDKGTFYDYLFA